MRSGLWLKLRSCSTQIGFWPGPTTIHFSSYYGSCADLLSSDASARGRLHWYLEEPAYGTLAHESSFGTHTSMHHWRWWEAMHHWRCWRTSSHQLNWQVSILTQRGKKSRAPRVTLAQQKKNWCIFVPYVRGNELVVSDLPNSFPSHLSFSPILPPCVIARGPWVVRCPKKRGFDTSKAFWTHWSMCTHCTWYAAVGKLNHLYVQPVSPLWAAAVSLSGSKTSSCHTVHGASGCLTPDCADPEW